MTPTTPSSRRKAPAHHTWEACQATGYNFTYSKREVPMGYRHHEDGSWSSICWFGKGQYYKVFINGQGYGCARTIDGVKQLVETIDAT